MQDEMTRIADRVRGIAAERHTTQEQIATMLGLSRQAVNLRLNGKRPFLAPEIQKLADEFDVGAATFFEDRAS